MLLGELSQPRSRYLYCVPSMPVAEGLASTAKRRRGWAEPGASSNGCGLAKDEAPRAKCPHWYKLSRCSVTCRHFIPFRERVDSSTVKGTSPRSRDHLGSAIILKSTHLLLYALSKRCGFMRLRKASLSSLDGDGAGRHICVPKPVA